MLPPPVLIVSVENTSGSYVRKIMDLVRSRIGVECDVKSCSKANVTTLLIDADKAGVWFAIVVWPEDEATDKCALNLLRFTFGSDTVGYDDLNLNQAVDLVHDEYFRLQHYMGQSQPQYYNQQQQPMMYSQQQPMVPVQSSTMGVPPPSALPGVGGASSLIPNN